MDGFGFNALQNNQKKVIKSEIFLERSTIFMLAVITVFLLSMLALENRENFQSS